MNKVVNKNSAFILAYHTPGTG